MENKLRNYVREIAQVLNDEALFHKREIPGDADDFEDRQNPIDSGESRHVLYTCINELIQAYDLLDENQCVGQVQEAILGIKDAVENLKLKI